jgi:WD40 repeat protein
MRFYTKCWVGFLLLGLVSGSAPETADVAKNKAASEKQTNHKATSKPLPLIHYAQSGVIAFSTDGKTIASGGGAVCLHDLTTGRLLWRTITDFKQQETCAFLVFSPDGRYLAAAYKGGFIGSPNYVVLWEVTPERKLHNRRVLLARPRGDNDLPTTVYHAQLCRSVVDLSVRLRRHCQSL